MSKNNNQSYVDRGVYISLDIETTGPIPGPNSMLSLGAVAYNGSGKELGVWYKKFTMLPGSDYDLDTYKWWLGFPEAFKEATSNPEPWKFAIADFVSWTTNLKKSFSEVNLMASPATFDGMFVNWYAVSAMGNYSVLPWKHRILDIRSYIAAVLKFPYHTAVSKKAFDLLDYVDNNQRPHFPVDDARAQGGLFFAAKAYRENVLYKKKALWKTPNGNSASNTNDSSSVDTANSTPSLFSEQEEEKVEVTL